MRSKHKTEVGAQPGVVSREVLLGRYRQHQRCRWIGGFRVSQTRLARRDLVRRCLSRDSAGVWWRDLIAEGIELNQTVAPGVACRLECED